MKTPEQDQAAGLRRMFKQFPPEVLTVVPCGATATPWVVRQLHARLKAGLKVLTMDEWAACGNLADCLGVSPQYDLLHVVEGAVSLQQCTVQPLPGLSLVPVAKLSRALGQDRITQQRTIECLRQLQVEADEWLIHARPCDVAGLSALALAAPRLLLAVDPQPKAVTEAYITLKRLRVNADTLSVGLAVTGPTTAETRALAANLQSVARRQLGIGLIPLSSLGEAYAMPDAEPGERQVPGSSPVGFEERLRGMTRQVAATRDARNTTV